MLPFQIPMSECSCQSGSFDPKVSSPVKSQSAFRSAGTFGLSLALVFSPKCPLCLAAYSSAIGIVCIPAFKFVLPVLVIMLGIHLLVLFDQSKQVGYGPFLVSAGGVIVILVGRQYAPLTHWLMEVGIALMLGGTTWNVFSVRRRKTLLLKLNNAERIFL